MRDQGRSSEIYNRSDDCIIQTIIAHDRLMRRRGETGGNSVNHAKMMQRLSRYMDGWE